MLEIVELPKKIPVAVLYDHDGIYLAHFYLSCEKAVKDFPECVHEILVELAGQWKFEPTIYIVFEDIDILKEEGG